VVTGLISEAALAVFAGADLQPVFGRRHGDTILTGRRIAEIGIIVPVKRLLAWRQAAKLRPLPINDLEKRGSSCIKAR